MHRASGLYVGDVLGRPVTRIPEGGRADFIDEIAMTVAGTAGATALDCGVMGLRTRAISTVGQDALGDFMIDELERVGVDCSAMARTSEVQTSATILPVCPNGERPALHVPGTAATFELTPEMTEAALAAKVVHLGAPGCWVASTGRLRRSSWRLLRIGGVRPPST